MGNNMGNKMGISTEEGYVIYDNLSDCYLDVDFHQVDEDIHSAVYDSLEDVTNVITEDDMNVSDLSNIEIHRVRKTFEVLDIYSVELTVTPKKKENK